MAASRLYVDPEAIEKSNDGAFARYMSGFSPLACSPRADTAAAPFSSIENHYFMNKGFMRDGQLLEKGQI